MQLEIQKCQFFKEEDYLVKPTKKDYLVQPTKSFPTPGPGPQVVLTEYSLKLMKEVAGSFAGRDENVSLTSTEKNSAVNHPDLLYWST